MDPVALRYGAPLFFANSEFVVLHLRRELRARHGSVRWLISDAEAVTVIDANSLQSPPRGHSSPSSRAR